MSHDITQTYSTAKSGSEGWSLCNYLIFNSTPSSTKAPQHAKRKFAFTEISNIKEISLCTENLFEYFICLLECLAGADRQSKKDFFMR